MTTIALIQMRCGTQPDENLTKAPALIERAAKRGAQLVCLPELFRSLYFCQTEDHDNFKLAEPIPGPTTEALGRADVEPAAGRSCARWPRTSHARHAGGARCRPGAEAPCRPQAGFPLSPQN